MVIRKQDRDRKIHFVPWRGTSITPNNSVNVTDNKFLYNIMYIATLYVIR